jgi:integrase
MSSVYKKKGSAKWWAKLKGYKVAGKWSGKPTPYKNSDELKPNAERWAAHAQKRIDERALVGETSPLTVRDYAKKWLDDPARQALASYPDMKGHLHNHVLPIIGDKRLADVRSRDFRDLIRKLKAKISDGGISPKTVHNIYGTIRTMFNDAKGDELIAVVPEVDTGELPEKVDKDPEWRDLATYQRAEVRLMITSTKVPPERRIQYGLKALSGLRHGEVAGLRWRLWDRSLEPLTMLSIARTYVAQGTKTKVPRRVPVHPELARMLVAWLDLWPTIYGRAPEPDDYIVPTRKFTPVDPSDAIIAFKADLEGLGLRVNAGAFRARGGHDMRAWFMSTGVEDGANIAVLQRITHTKKKDVVSGYTRLPWHVLCEAVACIKMPLGPEPLPLGTDELPRIEELRRSYNKRRLAMLKVSDPDGIRTRRNDSESAQEAPNSPESLNLATSCDLSISALVTKLGTDRAAAENPSDRPPGGLQEPSTTTPDGSDR